jgi:probable HAF family extracellular repeat protein
LSGCDAPVAPTIDEQAAYGSVARLSTTGVPIQIIPALDGCYPGIINDGGTIIGDCGTGPHSNGFVWSADLGRIDLGVDTWVNDINNRGEVLGSRTLPSGATRGFVWTRAEGFFDLPPLGENEAQFLSAINDYGVVTGNSYSQGVSRPFKWTRSDGITELLLNTCPLPPTYYSDVSVFDVDNKGRIYATARTLYIHSVIYWLPFDGCIDLSERGTPWELNIDAADANDAGQITGHVQTGDSSYVFVYTPYSGSISLAPGVRWRSGRAIDNKGVVAGEFHIGDGPWPWPQHGFIWNQGNLVDLGTLGGVSSTVSDMNERGVVLGTAEDERNRTRTVIWRTR